MHPSADKMQVSDIRGVHRALAFAESLEHEHLVKVKGTWEMDDMIYVVEEYAVRGDLLQVRPCHAHTISAHRYAVTVCPVYITSTIYGL
jgi:hypothetical protein